MKRVKKIIYYLPDLSKEHKDNNEYLFRLLIQLKNIKKSANNLIGHSKSLLPKTVFIRTPINSPQISFEIEGDNKKIWKVGNLIFGFNLTNPKKEKEVKQSQSIEILTDEVGSYARASIKGKNYYLLSLKQLFGRLKNNLLELNHSGMNFGPEILSKSDYLAFKKSLAKHSNLYNYPTGEEWPFIIPATKKEYSTDIKDETVNRNPKFELVYSKYHPKPLIQFDIETKMTKAKLLKLLPKPYGISFPGLENYFRTVYIFTNWSDVVLRLDLRFKSKSKKDFGYWMIKKGGRIK